MEKRVRRKGIEPVIGSVQIHRNGGLFDESSAVIQSDDEEMTDYVTPDFKARINAGEILNNPCNYTRVSSSAGGGSLKLVNKSDPNDIYLSSGSGSITLHEFNTSPVQPIAFETGDRDSYAVSQAKAKALGFLDSSPYKFGEDILELHKTIRYLRNPVGSLVKLGKDFRKQYKRDGARFRRELLNNSSQTWLEYRFALSPLLRSMQSALDAYVKGIPDQAPERITARGTSEVSISDTDEHEYIIGSHASDFYFRSTKYTNYVRAGIMYRVANPIRDASFLLGLRGKDIPEALWAIAPYSFMVDRVTDISGAIRGITALSDPSVEVLAGWTTEKKTTLQKRAFLRQVNSLATATVVPDVFEQKFFEYDRKVWKPTVADVFVPPQLGGLIDSTAKVLDLLALSKGLFSLESNSALKKKLLRL